jgi:hypothetical protein
MSGNEQEIPQKVLDAAYTLARANREAEAEITQIFLAPAQDRVLLVEVDPTAVPNDERGAVPLYFRSAPAEGIPLPSGVVIVTPEEQKSQIPLPERWGSWEKLILIWPQEG